MWHILIWHWSETVFGAGVIGLRNAGFFVFGIFDENKKRMRLLDWRQDKNYLDYIDSGSVYSQKYRKIIRYKKHVGGCRIAEYLL